MDFVPSPFGQRPYLNVDYGRLPNGFAWIMFQGRHLLGLFELHFCASREESAHALIRPAQVPWDSGCGIGRAPGLESMRAADERKVQKKTRLSLH